MTSVFPDRLQAGGRAYINQTISFAQIRLDGGQIKVRLQAIEIMKQFEGDVTYGNDPRGILFYNSLIPFQHSAVNFTYERISDTGNFVTLQINFKARNDPTDFARFVARVDTTIYKIPGQSSGGGLGRWRNFRIATTEALAFRAGNSPNVTLQFGPVRREVVFPSNRTTEFSVNGLFMFKDISQLKDEPVPQDNRKMHVHYTPDICVFRYAPNSGREQEFGLFLRKPEVVFSGMNIWLTICLPANSPLDFAPNLQPPQVRWYDFVPDVQALAAEAEDTPADVVEDDTA